MVDFCCTPTVASKADRSLDKAIQSPQKLHFDLFDYFKAFFSWFRAFKKTNVITPGLYFTGEKYDIDTPLLVTANYHLTVFNLWRNLRRNNVRILVIDTDGINVWCSSGKGKFSAQNIIDHLSKYNSFILAKSNRVEIILPKLSLSGVSLRILSDNGIKPVIGPIYMKDLPEYLAKKPYQDRIQDRYRFSFKDRLFTLPPSLLQIFLRALIVFAVLFVWDTATGNVVTWQIILPIFSITVLYIVLFPLLPSKTFVIKSFPLGLVLISLFILDNMMFQHLTADIFSLLFLIFFTISFSVYFGLYYTGNSGASNYSLVKKEIIRYLPVSFVSFVFAFVTLIVKEIVT